MTCTHVSGGRRLRVLRCDRIGLGGVFGTEIAGKPTMAWNTAKLSLEMKRNIKQKLKNLCIDPTFVLLTQCCSVCHCCVVDAKSSEAGTSAWTQVSSVYPLQSGIGTRLHMTAPPLDAWHQTQKLCSLTPPPPLSLSHGWACRGAGLWLVENNTWAESRWQCGILIGLSEPAVQSAADLNRAFVCACLHLHTQASGNTVQSEHKRQNKGPAFLCVHSRSSWAMEKSWIRATRLVLEIFSSEEQLNWRSLWNERQKVLKIRSTTVQLPKFHFFNLTVDDVFKKYARVWNLQEIFYILALMELCVEESLMIPWSEHLILYYIQDRLLIVWEGRFWFEEFF